jgi:protein-S-isoprenylcysteine O-methyltransferase Ste14
MSQGQLTRWQLVKMVVVRFGAGLIGLGVLFFLPAGTLGYWQAWVWLGILGIPLCVLLVYMFRSDPGLLERRLRFREREPEQSLIIKLSYIPALVLFVLPGLDHRFGWSNVATVVILGADFLVFLGYCLFALVIRANSYASRVVEVEQQQTVVSTGPYAVVRHPMYLAVMLIYAASPLALGSYWAMIPAAFIVSVLVARIRNEEKVLLARLAGYSEFVDRVRYRMIPGVW